MKSKSERQVLAPPPKYEGNIVATYENERWAADLISFVSRPVKAEDGQFAYILLVQDIFSRYLYGRALRKTGETTAAFEDILDESEARMTDADYKSPARLDSDGGNEFTNEGFRSMLRARGISHVVKAKEDLQATAVLDAAIQNIKKALARRVKAKNSDWLAELDAAIKGYNDSFHSTIHTEPNDISDADVFALKKQAAEDLQENTDLIRKRQENLKDSKAFRVYLGKPPGGLRQRADKARWSNKIHTMEDFLAPGVVKDTEGKDFFTKLVKPVPADSSAIAEDRPYDLRGSAQVDAARKTALRPYIERLVALTQDGTNLGRLTTLARREIEGFADQMKKQKVNLKQVIALFPQDLKLREDGKVVAMTSSSGARSTPFRRLRRLSVQNDR